MGEAMLIALTFFGTTGFVLLIVFLNPDKTEKWASIFWGLVFTALRRGKKKAIALDIQGRVNSFVRTLNDEIPHIDATGMRIQWVPTDEDREDFFKGDRLVVRMREHEDQDKNFVAASMVFISRCLLPATKKYISQKQGQALDLFTAKKILEVEKPRVVDRFFEDFFSPGALGDQKIMGLLEQFETVDKVGLYFIMLVQELAFLGDKVFFGPKRDEIIVEVARFIDYLENYANRAVGDETTPLAFKGMYCRTAIVIVALAIRMEIGDTRPYVNRIGKLLAQEFEQIYVLGSSGSDNVAFIQEIVDQAVSKYGLSEFSRTEFDARIRTTTGDRRKVGNIVILLRSRDSKRYYDAESQKKFIDGVTGTEPQE